jgi:hypothetical protein
MIHHDRSIIFTPRPRFPAQVVQGDTIDQLADALAKRERLMAAHRFMRDTEHENRDAALLLIDQRISSCDLNISVLSNRLLWGIL